MTRSRRVRRALSNWPPGPFRRPRRYGPALRIPRASPGIPARGAGHSRRKSSRRFFRGSQPVALVPCLFQQFVGLRGSRPAFLPAGPRPRFFGGNPQVDPGGGIPHRAPFLRHGTSKASGFPIRCFAFSPSPNIVVDKGKKFVQIHRAVPPPAAQRGSHRRLPAVPRSGSSRKPISAPIRSSAQFRRDDNWRGPTGSGVELADLLLQEQGKFVDEHFSTPATRPQTCDVSNTSSLALRGNRPPTSTDRGAVPAQRTRRAGRHGSPGDHRIVAADQPCRSFFVG